MTPYLLFLPAQRRTGSGIRFYGATHAADTGTSIEWGDMDVSPATPKPAHGNLETSSSSRVGGGHNTVVIILPFWQAAFLGQSWPMLTDLPSLIAVTSSSLVPPSGYQRWNKSKYTSIDHMLTSKTWRNLIGLRLSGADKSRGVWIQNWRKQLASFTRHEREKHEADTFKAHGHFFSQSSGDVTAAVTSLSQMLSFAM
jgi:hypothetical protein